MNKHTNLYETIGISPPTLNQETVPYNTPHPHLSLSPLTAHNTHSSLAMTGKGLGPRYCPSLEAKVEKFKDKDKHQVFLEPEGKLTHLTQAHIQTQPCSPTKQKK